MPQNSNLLLLASSVCCVVTCYHAQVCAGATVDFNAKIFATIWLHHLFDLACCALFLPIWRSSLNFKEKGGCKANDNKAGTPAATSAFTPHGSMP
jgi:hypothetical protein